MVRALDRRMAALTGLDLRPPYAEYLQVVNYGLGGHYEPHFDHATVRERPGWAVGAMGYSWGGSWGGLWDVPGDGPGLAFRVIPQTFLKESSWVVPQIFLEMGPGMLLMKLPGWYPREDPKWSLGVSPW